MSAHFFFLSLMFSIIIIHLLIFDSGGFSLFRGTGQDVIVRGEKYSILDYQIHPPCNLDQINYGASPGSDLDSMILSFQIENKGTVFPVFVFIVEPNVIARFVIHDHLYEPVNQHSSRHAVGKAPEFEIPPLQFHSHGKTACQVSDMSKILGKMPLIVIRSEEIFAFTAPILYSILIMIEKRRPPEGAESQPS